MIFTNHDDDDNYNNQEVYVHPPILICYSKKSLSTNQLCWLINVVADTGEGCYKQTLKLDFAQ